MAFGLVAVGIGVALGVHTALKAPGFTRDTVYNGSYIPLTCVHMNSAYASTIALDFDRTHDHLVAGIVVGAIGLLLAAFGAYRLVRPPHPER